MKNIGEQLVIKKESDIIQKLLAFSTAFLLLGKGILHFTSDQPYSLLFVNASLIDIIFGSILIICGLMVLIPAKVLRKSNVIYLISLSSILLLIQSYCTFITASYVPEQIIEHTLQIALPIIFIYRNVIQSIRINRLNTILCFCVSLTFIGHGIFALGVHYLPDQFVELTMQWLPFDLSQSERFLFVIGLLDIIFALLIFVPGFRINAIWYLIVWGLLTSIARTYFSFEDGITLDLFTQKLPNTIYRLPHGLIPIVILINFRKMDQNKKMELITNKI